MRGTLAVAVLLGTALVAAGCNRSNSASSHNDTLAARSAAVGTPTPTPTPALALQGDCRVGSTVSHNKTKGECASAGGTWAPNQAAATGTPASNP